MENARSQEALRESNFEARAWKMVGVYNWKRGREKELGKWLPQQMWNMWLNGRWDQIIKDLMCHVQVSGICHRMLYYFISIVPHSILRSHPMANQCPKKKKAWIIQGFYHLPPFNLKQITKSCTWDTHHLLNTSLSNRNLILTLLSFQQQSITIYH